MIIIFSQELDISTCDVIDWLDFYNVDFIRINVDDEAQVKIRIFITEEKSRIAFDYKGTLFDLGTVSSYWYRRGGVLRLTKPIILHKILKSKKVLKEVQKDLWQEAKAITDFISQYLKNNVPHIGERESSFPNKLTMLQAASNVGLKIPKTLITNSKKDIEEFKLNTGSIITKGVQESLHFSSEDCFYSVYTEEIQYVTDLPEYFHPSLFQQKIEKKFEIRTFYIQGDFYSMAIFSQNDPQTKIDFRKYNEKKPNRNVPFKLPHEIASKLTLFMKKMDMSSGSIDLVYTISGQFVFLEVNPIGQFAMTSEPCNYYLERIIANKLSQYELNKKSKSFPEA